MLKGFIASVFVVVMLAGFSSGYSQTNETALVDKYISKQAAKTGGEEYGDARKILRGDLNGDKRSDIVVLYTLEGFGGGNAYTQYLAVFLGKGKTIQFAASTSVGGRLYRDVDLKSITASKIDLDTKEYRKNDAACCPSRPGKTRYVLRNGKLRETK